MNVCRICLAKNVQKDVLKIYYNENMTYADIILFCLDVKVSSDSKITSLICMKCYRKLVTFYKFKLLAQKNNEHLKTHHKNQIVKYSITDKAPVFEMKEEFEGNESFLQEYADLEIKEEPEIIEHEIKEEEYYDLFDNDNDISSDDEVLSKIKQQKNAFDLENIEEIGKKVTHRSRKKNCKKSHETKVCEECGISVRNLREHVLKHIPHTDRKVYPCPSCSKTYQSPHGRAKHIKRRHRLIRPKCDICGKEVFDIIRHKRVVHDKDLPFQCTLCEKRYICKTILEAHYRTHSKDRPYPCDVCEKKFGTSIALKMHVRQVHEQERPHMCHVCSKTFFKKYHLQIHIRKHTREKPCKCDECGKCFSSTTILGKHKLRHSGVKNFACTLCDMTFFTNGALQTHMISHTKIKRFPCSYCGIKFGRTDHRNRHERTAHMKDHPTFPNLDSTKEVSH